MALAGGTLAIAPMPGRDGRYASDLATVVAWSPSLVISLVETAELAAHAGESLGGDLCAARIDWCHIPVPDFGIPATLDWPQMRADVLARLGAGEKVLVHCMGGCGRSGMIALRLLISAGVPANEALARLRRTRPCAVETDAQMAWAMQDERPV